MSNLKLTDFLLLREEIHSLLDSLSQRGFSLDDTSNMDFQKIRYKRLVRLYNTLDSCILDLLDDEAEDPVEVFPNNSENIVNYRSYDTIFENYYRSWFKDCSSHELVKQEDILCKMIDSDLVSESLLIDEVIKMRELIHDEALRRMSFTCPLEL